jgi:hypothetical protein
MSQLTESIRWRFERQPTGGQSDDVELPGNFGEPTESEARNDMPLAPTLLATKPVPVPAVIRRPPSPAKVTGEPETRWVDKALDAGSTLGITALIGVGFTVSYNTLRNAALDAGFSEFLAPAVPLSFDVGIITLSLKVYRLAREGRTAPILRAIIIALSIATVVANAAAGDTLASRILHGIPSAMFVICFESMIVSARRHALQRMGLVPPALPRVRPIRWVLAPKATGGEWKRMVLAQNDAHTRRVEDLEYLLAEYEAYETHARLEEARAEAAREADRERARAAREAARAANQGTPAAHPAHDADPMRAPAVRAGADDGVDLSRWTDLMREAYPTYARLRDEGQRCAGVDVHRASQTTASESQVRRWMNPFAARYDTEARERDAGELRVV